MQLKIDNKIINYVLMPLLIFLIIFNQNITRGIKDTLLVSYVGADIISFVKMFVEVPVGILFTLLYTKLCNHISVNKIFILIVLFFIIYFLTFGFVLFENRISLEIDLVKSINARLKWLLILSKNWVIVMFYVMAEMWPVITCMFFWELANRITTANDAKKIYPLLSLVGQTSLIASGALLSTISSYSIEMEGLIKILISIVAISAMIIIFLYKLILVKLPHSSRKNFNVLLKLDIKSSFKVINNSYYLKLVGIVCMSYHISMNLMESVWFFKTKQIYSETRDFMAYQGLVLYYTGLFTLVLGFFGPILISKFGWVVAAIATPLMILISGTTFFVSVILQIFNILDLNLLIIGAMQNIIGRGTKYVFYDATKEMLYINLDPEMKTKGKAAIDIIGVKLGRLIGVLMQIVFFTAFPFINYDLISIPIMICFIVVCLIWINAIRKLHLVK